MSKAKNDAVIEKIAKYIGYDPDTGALWWADVYRDDLTDRGRKIFDSRFKGREIKHKNSEGYICLRYSSRLIRGHRVAFYKSYGYLPDEVDHQDHNRSNNSLSNLISSNSLDNGKNQRIKSSNTSGVNGVSFCKRREKWRAYITVNNKQNHLGYFDSIEEAIKARKQADKYHGFHKNHGAKPCN